MINHPCQNCGACCAYFRVSFHWSETLSESHAVPEALTVKVSPHHSAMIGTTQKDPHCGSLKGEVGVKVQCQIYDHRPSPCREFQASFENGIKNDRCEKARTAKNMAHLTLADWI